MGKWKEGLRNVDILDFRGGPVVKTFCFHCRGHGFQPWLGKFCVPRGVAKKKKS